MPMQSDGPEILRTQDSATCRKPDGLETFTRIRGVRPETGRRHHGAELRGEYLTSRHQKYRHYDKTTTFIITVAERPQIQRAECEAAPNARTNS